MGVISGGGRLIPANSGWHHYLVDLVTTAWVSQTGLFAADGAVAADLHGLATLPLLGRHELDVAVALPVVLPVHK